MQDTKNFEYLFLVNNEFSLTYRKVKQVIYKIALDKIFDQINYINRVIYRLVDNVSKQIRSLFERYLQKNIQLIQFKSAITIILQKLDKKNYSNAKIYKSITLLDILSKILKLIISKRLRYIVEITNTLLNIQIKVCRYNFTNIALQFIIEKIYTI